METLADSRLVILHSDGNDGIKYWPIKEAKEVSVGCDLTCDIRLKQEGIKDRHFTIYINSLGKVKNFNEPVSIVFLHFFLLLFLFVFR